MACTVLCKSAPSILPCVYITLGMCCAYAAWKTCNSGFSLCSLNTLADHSSANAFWTCIGSELMTLSIFTVCVGCTYSVLAPAAPFTILCVIDPPCFMSSLSFSFAMVLQALFASLFASWACFSAI